MLWSGTVNEQGWEDILVGIARLINIVKLEAFLLRKTSDSRVLVLA